MVYSQLSKICGTSSHVPAWGGILMGKMEAHFCHRRCSNRSIDWVSWRKYFRFLCVIVLGKPPKFCFFTNMIDNRQVEILSPSLNSIHHRGMVLVSGLVCYKYNIRGKGDRPSCEIWGRKWSFNIHLTHLSSLSSQQAIHPANDDVWLRVWV